MVIQAYGSGIDVRTELQTKCMMRRQCPSVRPDVPSFKRLKSSCFESHFSVCQHSTTRALQENQVQLCEEVTGSGSCLAAGFWYQWRCTCRFCYRNRCWLHHASVTGVSLLLCSHTGVPCFLRNSLYGCCFIRCWKQITVVIDI
jgi:hypothetical protein